MKTNLEVIAQMVDYIEAHLDEALDLDSLSRAAGYSKYHLSKLFAGLVGFPLHQYIQRRRLTEAARRLAFTEERLLDIALSAGYETQQSFTRGFKALYRCSPRTYRRRRAFYPLQLKFAVDGENRLRGDRLTDVLTVEQGPLYLAGFSYDTRGGFCGIGRCWRKLHKVKGTIPNRADIDFLIGLNDYASWDSFAGQPAFLYYAAAEITSPKSVLPNLAVKELPPSKYVVFRFRGRNEDSLEPVADFIYKEWFPQSTCRLNEDARYDFAKYGEAVDENGKSLIEYWVPVL